MAEPQRWEDEDHGTNDVEKLRTIFRERLHGEQPDPVPNELPAVWDLVVADMRARDAVGRKRYGVPLQPHNGRDNLVDAFHEALDLAVYLRALIYERDGK